MGDLDQNKENLDQKMTNYGQPILKRAANFKKQHRI